jgi:hypothetical protein
MGKDTSCPRYDIRTQPRPYPANENEVLPLLFATDIADVARSKVVRGMIVALVWGFTPEFNNILTHSAYRWRIGEMKSI